MKPIQPIPILHAIALAVLLAALLGPWLVTDRIHVPAQYECQAPFIRLQGDFCGLQVTAVGIFWRAGVELLRMALSWAMGRPEAAADFGRGLLVWSVGLVFLVGLPVASAWRSLQGGEKPRRLLHVAVWAAAGGLGVFLAANIQLPGDLQSFENFANLALGLWGLWLYLILAFSMAGVEVVTWRRQTWNSHLHRQSGGRAGLR